MKLPVNAIKKMKSFFGSDGNVHKVSGNNIWIETDCLEWKLPSFDLEIPKISQSLAEELEKVSHKIKGEDFYTKVGYLDQKKYASRFREAFEQQATLELRNELNTFTPKLLEFTKQQEVWHRTRKDVLKKVRKLLQGEPVIAYWSGIEWEGNTPETIVVAPATDPFEILMIEQTNGANFGLSTNDIVTHLKLIDKEYGIDITGASFDGLDFILIHTPKGKEAKELGKLLLGFCPDLYEAPQSFPKGKVSLWWD